MSNKYPTTYRVQYRSINDSTWYTEESIVAYTIEDAVDHLVEEICDREGYRLENDGQVPGFVVWLVNGWTGKRYKIDVP